ncbi:Uncharacterized protein OS=Burkholderia pseudomallei GN=DO72_3911 PE=4 SV=1 [Tuwongella immobilis]|uniref:Uncharacterized protein n=1 Tax=Tuwongella immobilis TaxID=692036 RepID=A0A6C2YK27_9BACT|nr:Uncharacterized protein OS=Burkholderia pseudomallei GN=DO72_3911 PE=4 SV=1 [Tuwongella immobilis]VTR99041.1 Uncharacterized protein OS=Burkholderia pseudomallei GN=DO72_3911 PE=4 SV=1 [Tuwongella immobilis]
MHTLFRLGVEHLWLTLPADAPFLVVRRRPTPGATQARRSAFFDPLQFYLQWPICSNNSPVPEPSGCSGFGAPLANHTLAPSRSCFFQSWIMGGWTPNCPASSLTVLSPLSAAKATFALNSAECRCRFFAIDSHFSVTGFYSLAGGPISGVHYKLPEYDDRFVGKIIFMIAHPAAGKMPLFIVFEQGIEQLNFGGAIAIFAFD